METFEVTKCIFTYFMLNKQFRKTLQKQNCFSISCFELFILTTRNCAYYWNHNGAIIRVNVNQRDTREDNKVDHVYG